MIRPFQIQDFLTLRQIRNNQLCLNNRLSLTRNASILSGALLSVLDQATGVFTSICLSEDGSVCELFGQIAHTPGCACAYLTFLAPRTNLETNCDLSSLFDYFASQIGERGGYHILAEADERNPAFQALRESGFAIFARQKVWCITGDPLGKPKNTPWDTLKDRDILEIQSLYRGIVPALVQDVEPPPAERHTGAILRNKDAIQAFVNLEYGPRGIIVTPFFHPEMDHVDQSLVDLLMAIPNRRSRPIYLTVRSYQAWLDPILDQIGALSGQQQAVMVKHLAVALKVTKPLTIPALESRHPEVSAPFSRIKNQHKL